MRVERDFVWAGAGYRFNQSYMVTAGLNVSPQFSVGYAFDNYLTPVNGFAADKAGGHELVMRYNFKHKKSTAKN